MKKKSLKVKVLELAKNELQQIKGGTRSMDDCEEVTCTGKKKSS
ncbi:MAG: bacteriocin [Bacteroidales bacterium]|jgi:bacteriocin-like protein|nr:bacteriocin [Bacteroidales bacterium]